MLSQAQSLASLPPSQRQAVLSKLTEAQARELQHDWNFWGRPNQILPGSPYSSNPRTDWVFWLLLAGRGFGKSKTGAETVKTWAQDPQARILLVGPTAGDVRDVMIEGPSGLMSCYPSHERPAYYPTRHLIRFPSGALGITRSAEEPERLRGPQFNKFWTDENCAWKYVDDAWDQLSFGFRMKHVPLQGVLTTTPKPIKWLRKLIANPATVVTRGSSYDNRANLSETYYQEVIRPYEGTRLGRQEINAEILDDIPGALWTRARIESSRCLLRDVEPLVRVVVAVDPAVSAKEGSDETGIVVVGVGRRFAYVLEDASQRAHAAVWAETVVRLARKWNADRIVAEVNNGGELVERNIRMAAGGAQLPYRAVHSSRGKIIRAEPAATLYERGLVRHVGLPLETGVDGSWMFRGEPIQTLETLEDQMCSYVPGNESPDRMDALVFALTDLVITPQIIKHQSQIGGWQSISPV